MIFASGWTFFFFFAVVDEKQMTIARTLQRRTCTQRFDEVGGGGGGGGVLGPWLPRTSNGLWTGRMDVRASCVTDERAFASSCLYYLHYVSSVST